MKCSVPYCVHTACVKPERWGRGVNAKAIRLCLFHRNLFQEDGAEKFLSKRKMMVKA